MNATPDTWGDQIATESIGGIPYRMYTQRPRRVSSVLGFAPAWGERAHIIQGEQVLSFAQFHAAVQAKADLLAPPGIGQHRYSAPL